MSDYSQFKIASYAHAPYLAHTSEAEILRQIDYFKKYLGGLDKVYLEIHRGEHHVLPEELRRYIELFRENGITVAGGFTATTDLEVRDVHRIFDVYCYSRENFREELRKNVASTAQYFDELILDDFFFTSCRCKECIRRKGTQSWPQYRLNLMKEMAQLVCDTAKSVNPDCKCVIKYPNWFESWQETGYNPKEQKDIFDGIYTAAESRNPKMSQQHLPRYLSYSLVRYMENAAPGKNLGAWIDTGDSSNNMNWYAQQVLLAALAGAKELCLFGFGGLMDEPWLPMLGESLKAADTFMAKAGKNCGVPVYYPFNADQGEDQLFNYIGMLGIPLEPTPYFNKAAKTMFLTAAAAQDENLMDKLKAYVENGGHAVITGGLLRILENKGILDMTSARPGTSVVSGTCFCTDPYIGDRRDFHSCPEPVMLHSLDYKTNATWSEAELITENCNYPVFLRDDYGSGELYVWNIPDNFSDLYKLPMGVLNLIRQNFAKHLDAYIEADPQYNLFLYDNNMLAVQSYREYREYMTIVIKGACEGLKDLVSGQVYRPVGVKARPEQRFDVVWVPVHDREYAFEIYFQPGTVKYFEIMRI